MIKAVRREVGSDYPLSFRFSQWKQQDFTARLAQTPDELARFLKPLADAGVDIFHCSTRRFWEPEFEGSDLNLAGWTKKLTGKPTITVGSVGLSGEFLAAYSGETSQVANLDGLLERLAGGEFDLVAVGRSVLGDHTWARKLREERFNELQPFKPESLKEYY
jgi:2,4-dienoyl-CoA reductase-like NADH-dependent reductase (Old Yellow Enzyme family)